MTDLDKLQRRFANKSSQYWARMRSLLNLVYRSKKMTDADAEALRSQLSTILDSGILIYPQYLKKLGITEEMSYREAKIHLELCWTALDEIPEVEKFQRFMKNSADEVRKANWRFRISEEAERLQEKGWYPFFVTLTVDPEKANPEKLWKEGKAFRQYIRDLCKIVTDEMGLRECRKYPYKPESDFVRYAGVIEHGKSRLHHHGHFVIWLRTVPAAWSVDPNRGVHNPQLRVRNRCLPMQTLWPWSSPHPRTGESLSPCLYLRSIGDVWRTKHQFVVPWNTKQNQPQQIGPPRVVGAYITKYLQKEFKEWNHRVKATRNLGLQRLKATIAKLTLDQAMALSWRAKTYSLNLSVLKIHTVPQGLVRQLAKQQVYFRQFQSGQLDSTTLLKINESVYTKMLSSVRNGVLPYRMRSQEFYEWVVALLPDQSGYSDEKFVQAQHILADYWPPPPPPTKRVSQGGNNIGHP
jgi:hypothetical protein